MTPADSREIARYVNDGNARTSMRVDRFVSIFVALLVGVGLGVAIVCWATPCEALHLCTAVITPTTSRPALVRWAIRQRLWLHGCYLRWLIGSAEFELAHKQLDIDKARQEIAVGHCHVDALRCELRESERAARALRH